VSDAVHPLFPPAIPLLRDDGALQVGGVDTGDGVLVSPGGWVEPLLRGLDGRRAQRAVLGDARREGLDPAAVTAVLDGLRGAGLLVDLDPADLLASGTGPASTARTAAELPTGSGSGADGWRARRRATVVVEGATRVGVPLAALLAASGIGRIAVRDAGPARAGDAVVGGLTADDEGRPRSLAAADAVRRADPLADLRPVAPGDPVDLVVLARPWAASDPLVAALHRDGVPHLVATVRGGTGVVGPLVVPGATGCLRCGDLHRRDADPRWPRLAAQLTGSEPPASGATVTCLLTAVVGAVQALAFVEGGSAPAALDATLEMRPPALLPTRRAWPPHPSCACAADRQDHGRGTLGRHPARHPPDGGQWPGSSSRAHRTTAVADAGHPARRG
jgi:ThiF family